MSSKNYNTLIFLTFFCLSCGNVSFANGGDPNSFLPERWLLSLLQSHAVKTLGGATEVSVHLTVKNISSSTTGSLGVQLNSFPAETISGTGDIDFVFSQGLPNLSNYQVVVISYPVVGGLPRYCNLPIASGIANKSAVSLTVYCFGLTYSAPNMTVSSAAPFAVTPEGDTGGPIALMLSALPSYGPATFDPGDNQTMILNGTGSLSVNVNGDTTGGYQINVSIPPVVFPATAATVN